jgi:hypothetical protein
VDRWRDGLRQGDRMGLPRESFATLLDTTPESMALGLISLVKIPSLEVFLSKGVMIMESKKLGLQIAVEI